MIAFFVTGTGTDVGKTHVSAAILRSAAAGGVTVEATKPVMSGVDPGRLAESDAGRLLSAMGRAPTDAAIAALSPWRFAPALAPTAAARAEGRALPYADVLEFCRLRMSMPAQLHLVEGAGGVMSPIADGVLCLDLARDLGLPVVLVAGAYLGAVSHTLTALAALAGAGLDVAGVVVNEAGASGLPAEAVKTELEPFSTAPIHAWLHGQLDPPGALMEAVASGIYH
jgi:dethiobiotin synthetase